MQSNCFRLKHECVSFDEQSGKIGLEPYRDTAKKARVRNGVAWWVDQAQSSTVVLRSLSVPRQAMLVGSMFPVFLAGLGPKCQGEDDNSSCSGAPRLMHVVDGNHRQPEEWMGCCQVPEILESLGFEVSSNEAGLNWNFAWHTMLLFRFISYWVSWEPPRP